MSGFPVESNLVVVSPSARFFRSGMSMCSTPFLHTVFILNSYVKLHEDARMISLTPESQGEWPVQISRKTIRQLVVLQVATTCVDLQNCMHALACPLLFFQSSACIIVCRFISDSSRKQLPYTL